MRLFCSFGRRTQTSLGQVLVTTLVTACYRALRLMDSKCDFSQSRSEHTNIYGKGAGDDVSHCMLSGFESYG